MTSGGLTFVLWRRPSSRHQISSFGGDLQEPGIKVTSIGVVSG